MSDPTILLRRADLAPRTWREAERTVEVVAATEAPVERRDARGVFLEVLRIAPGAVDAAALVGQPVLDGHRRERVGDVLGSVVAAWIEGSTLVARLRFSERADVSDVVRDVAAGVLRFVSIGYRVDSWREDRAVDGRRVMLAERWTPLEVSLVPLPADAAARVRSSPQTGGLTVSEHLDPSVTADDTAPPEPLEPRASRAETNKAIRALIANLALPQALADALIDDEASLERARDAALAALIERSRAADAVRPRVSVGRSFDDPAQRRAWAAEGLAARAMNARVASVSEPARAYAAMSFAAIARETLERAGESTFGLSEAALITRAMQTTSDFPGLLADAASRVARDAYAQAPVAVRIVARPVTVTRLHDVTSSALSEARALPALAEGAEIETTPLTEQTATYAVKTYAGVFSLSRRALINDETGAFALVARRMGEAAAEAEAKAFVALLEANSGDGATVGGSAMFSTARGNKAATGGAIGAATLAAARAALRAVRGPNGTVVSVTPRFLLVPAALESVAEQWVAQNVVPSSAENVSPFAGKLTVVTEPRLSSASRWYLLGDLPQSNFEAARVAGSEEPRVEQRPAWNADAIEWRVTHDVGIGAVDWRGAFMNPGA